jgi:hypothetical protein
VFNGDWNEITEQLVLDYCDYKPLLTIPTLKIVDKKLVRAYSIELKEVIGEVFQKR